MAQRTAPPPPPVTDSGPAEGEVDARTSLEVVKDLVTNVQNLVRQEIELAKLEAIEFAAARGKALAAVAVAGVVGLFALGFLASAAAYGLEAVVPAWAARLIVAGVFIIVAVVALLVARAQTKIQAPPLETTKNTTKESVEWARQQLRR